MLYGELLGDVNLLAAPVIPLARIALSVLVREHRTDRLQHRLRDEIRRGDHLQSVPPALELPPKHPVDLRIDLGERGDHVLVGGAKPRFHYPMPRARFVYSCPPFPDGSPAASRHCIV